MDFQERLFSAMAEGVRERALHNAQTLVRGFAVLGYPIVVTEQYPKGLGTTLSGLREVLPTGTPVIEKTHFSCCDADGFMARIESPRSAMVVLCGMEAHICVLQTARGLVERGFGVAIADDAVLSRRKAAWVSALADARSAGARALPVESILLESLGEARGEAFKAISRLIR